MSANNPAPVSSDAEGNLCTLTFRVADMDCPSCVQKIEGQLQRIPGVDEISASVVNRTLTVRAARDVDPRAVGGAIGRLGYTARYLDDGGPAEERVGTFHSRAAHLTYASMAFFAVGVALRLLGVTPVLAELPLHTYTLPDLFYLLSAGVGGWNFFGKGLKAVRALALDMNFLMTVAILGATAIGETLEAAAIAFLFSLAELLEGFSVDRARASVESLMDLAPDTATLLDNGEPVLVPADALQPGDRILVRPGDRIPADGRVERGASAVDQSPITGESMPVDKVEGDSVFAGTINREGSLTIVVEREASRSTLARIVQLIEEAEANKSRTERFVERFARYYTPAVTLGAVFITVVPPVAFGAPFIPWFVRGLTLLVIACPCALVISTPVAVVSGITAAARHGVIIKGGIYLEAMGDVRAVAMDKTGTLTVGHPQVVAVLPAAMFPEDEDGLSSASAEENDGLSSASSGHAASSIAEASDQLLALAAAVEVHSEHPIARAIRDAAEQRGLQVQPGSDFTSMTGAGARARVDGAEIRVVRPTALSRPTEPPEELIRDGATVVAVERDGRLQGWIALSDALRPNADATVRALHAEGIEAVVMLTGDNERTARSIAARTGVDEVRAELLPEDKVAAIRELEARWGTVAMVGDGVNDGPALATATVGIAMGAAGSDTAVETADVALMGDDLTRLPYLKQLSGRARSVIRQNVALAILLKGALALGVPLGLVSLVMAVLVGDMGVSLLVILNALRLGRIEPAAS
ncbi:MAG: heavy metal translocating P-type ATPase [Gemmatimonadota bacterium]